ncbi:MAG: hypothetical protein EOM20_03825 [Spartobacteria bacterium]|nr:hypothetical protein [Spartobacteria bacterium]
MKRCRTVVGSIMLIVMVVVLAGCSSTSPVLLQLPSERGGTADIPLKVGVLTAEKSGEQKLSNIETCNQCGFFKFYAKMPRRSEVDYFSEAVGDYFRDTKTFSYCYNAPFDRNDVDLLFQIRMNDFQIENTDFGTVIGHASLIPYVGLLPTVWLLLGGKQETFLIQYDLEAIIETPEGKEIARYETSGSGKDGVTLYEQPFGNYMWYDSIFQQEFFKAMDYFVVHMKKDRIKIMQAAGK